MATHKFAAGDRVMLIPDGPSMNVARGTYTIVRVLPETSQGCQYRVKSASETHERVLNESQLRPV